MSTLIYRPLAEAIEALSASVERSTHPEDRKIVTDYLAVLAPILAKATLGQDDNAVSVSCRAPPLNLHVGYTRALP